MSREGAVSKQNQEGKGEEINKEASDGKSTNHSIKGKRKLTGTP